MNKRGFATGPLVAMLVIALAAAGIFMIANRSDRSSTPSMMGSGTEMTVPKASTPQMMELYADWCGPCRQMKPILNELEKSYKGKIKFMRVDIDKNPDMAKKFKVEAIPVQLFFDKSGKLVNKHVGFYSKAQIIAQFKKMGVK